MKTTLGLSPEAERRPFTRVMAAAGILLLEGLVFGATFHSQWLASDAPWWGGVVSRVSMLPSFAIAFLTAGVLLGRARIVAGWQAAQALSPPRSPAVWLALVVHLAAIAALTELTASALLDGRQADTAFGLAWFATGAVAAGSLAFWVLPLRALVAFAREVAGLAVGAMALAVVAWTAGNATMSLWWQPLRIGTFDAVRGVLGLVASDVIADPNRFEIGIGDFYVTVAPQCSGYEGVGLIAAFLAIYLVTFRSTLRFPRALLLLPLGVCLAWGANILRIAGLVALGAWVSPEVAIGGFHSYVGALTFCGLALGIAAAANRSTFFSRIDTSDSPSLFASPTAARLVPLLAILITTMSTGAVSVDRFDVLYPARVLVAATLLWAFRREYFELRWTLSPVAVLAGAVVFALWLGLEPPAASGADVEAKIAGLGVLGVVWVVFRAFGAIVTVPIAEELAFRSYLLRRVQSAEFWQVSLRHFSWAGFLVSSVAFGAMHDRLLAGTVAGMIYALVAYRRGEATDAIVAHATTNGLLVVYVLVTGEWSAMG